MIMGHLPTSASAAAGLDCWISTVDDICIVLHTCHRSHIGYALEGGTLLLHIP